MPITETEMLILATIESDELYGREITDAVAERTGGRRRLSLAGIYTTLARMEAKGLIVGRYGDHTDTKEGARRRYFKATGAGVKVLREMRGALSPNPKVAWGH